MMGGEGRGIDMATRRDRVLQDFPSQVSCHTAWPIRQNVALREAPERAAKMSCPCPSVRINRPVSKPVCGLSASESAVLEVAALC